MKIDKYVLAFMLAAAPAANAVAQQKPPRDVTQKSAERENDAAELAGAWQKLAQGRTGDAGAVAARLVTRNPRSGAALNLLLEVAIRTNGAAAGLAAYEKWLGQRTLEEPAAVRRIAEAVLNESAASSEVAVRAAAVYALVRAGSSRASDLEQLRSTAAGARSMAALGDQEAAEVLIKDLDTAPVGGVVDIEALGSSGNTAAIGPITSRLDSDRSEVRAAAAEALGRLNATGAQERLKPLLSDRNMYVRAKAAGALLRLGDTAGIDLLREMSTNTSAAIRLLAAEALAARPDEGWRALVRDLANTPDPEVQIGAARLLATFDPAAAGGLIEALEQHDNPVIRELVGRAGGEITSTDLSVLRRLLDRGNALGRVRTAARVFDVTR
jgi:hypothetical protein